MVDGFRGHAYICVMERIVIYERRLQKFLISKINPQYLGEGFLL